MIHGFIIYNNRQSSFKFYAATQANKSLNGSVQPMIICQETGLNFEMYTIASRFESGTVAELRKSVVLMGGKLDGYDGRFILFLCRCSVEAAEAINEILCEFDHTTWLFYIDLRGIKEAHTKYTRDAFFTENTPLNIITHKTLID